MRDGAGCEWLLPCLPDFVALRSADKLAVDAQVSRNGVCDEVSGCFDVSRKRKLEGLPDKPNIGAIPNQKGSGIWILKRVVDREPPPIPASTGGLVELLAVKYGSPFG